MSVEYVQCGESGESNGIRYHHHRGGINVTDLANAGKRGKVVRVLSVSYGPVVIPELHEFLAELRAMTYEEALAAAMSAQAAANERGEGWKCSLRESTPKGVDVRPEGFETLTLSNDNVCLQAGFESFSVRDLNDYNNMPTCIPPTYGGAKTAIKKFYKWASKVDLGTMTYSEVKRSMRDSGIKFHSYCAMD